MNSADTLKQFEAAQNAPAPWPDLPEDTLPVFPTDLLPGICGELVRAVAASVPMPVDYAACALLGSVSAAVVGRVRVRVTPDYAVPLQLYCGMAGESGTGKSPAMKMLAEPLVSWTAEQNKLIRKRNREKQNERDVLQQEERKKGLSTRARVDLRNHIDDIEDEPEVAEILGDVTPEKVVEVMSRQNGCGIVYTSEGNFVNVLSGASYGKQGGTSNLDAILQSYDSDPVRVDRIGRGTICLEQGNLSITVGLQPSMLARLAETTDLTDRGFPQRLLFFIPEELYNVDVIHVPPVPHHLREEWNQLLRTLASLYRTSPGELPLTYDAGQVLSMNRQSLHDRQQRDLGGNSALRAWSRKAYDKTIRLSGLLALLENPSASVVEEKHARIAVAMMNGYFIPHAKKAFGGSSSLSCVALDLWQIVRDQAIFRESALRHQVSGQKRFKSPAGKQCFLAALEELQREGYIRRTTLPGAGTGRTPSQAWETNPAGRTAGFTVVTDDSAIVFTPAAGGNRP